MAHRLFEELAAACPKWQQEFRTLREAVEQHDLGDLFEDFLTTEDGARYRAATEGVPDYVERNEQERAYREKLLNMVPGMRSAMTPHAGSDWGKKDR